VTTEHATTTTGLGPIRVQVPLVIEMSAEQVAHYAAANGLPHEGGTLRARHIVDGVRGCVLAALQDSPAFEEIDGIRGADVSIRGR
jgi:hypothetical protein